MSYTGMQDWQAQTAVPHAGGRAATTRVPGGGGQVIPSAASLIAAGSGTRGWVQVAPTRPGRKYLTVTNIGTNPCFVSPVGVGDTGPITLAAGASQTFDDEDAAWVWSNSGTTVDVTEGTWPLSGPSFSGPIGSIPDVSPIPLLRYS